MNAAAEIIDAVRQVGATLRVEGVSLVASNASRIAPAIKAAIRENKPQIISALLADGTACKVTIIELPQAQRYRTVFAHLQLKPPALVPVERWRQCVEDGKSFLAWSLGAAMITAHTDVVGSLLRPVALRKARDDWM